MTSSALPSQITSVTVYRHDAAVTRVCDLNLSDSAIPEEVRLSNLPLCLDDGSVSVKVKPVGSGAVPEACDVRVGLDVPAPDPDLPPPHNKELREAKRAVLDLETRINQLEQAVTRLQGLTAPERPRGARGEAPPPAPTAARLTLLEFRRAELERLGEQRATLLVQLEEARETLDVMGQRDENASQSRQAREHELRKSIVVRLRKTNGASMAPACHLVVEYLVPGAKWVPNYAIRFDEDKNTAELAMRAQVCQNTGEDWEKVSLRVATADPERWSELPELPALRIGRRQPPLPRTGWRPPPTGTEELFSDYERATGAFFERGASAPAPEEGLWVGQLPDSECDTLDDLAITGALEDEKEGFAGEEFGRSIFAKEFKAQIAAEMPVPTAARPAPLAAKSGLLSRAMSGILKDREMYSKNEDIGEKPPAEVTAELTAETSMLNYSMLRLGGIEDPGRGVLRPLSLEASYLEYLAKIHVSVDVDVTVSLGMAKARAGSVAGKSPPHGHIAPGAWEGFDHSYTADTTVSVPSDANFHNVPLSDRSGSIELRYVTVPRECSEVYRFLSIANPLDAPLPDGPADVYVDGDYLLTSQLHAVAPGGTIELGLGVEEAVKVARNVRFSERTSGLLKGSLGLLHEIEVDVTNNLSKDAAVEVRERIPIVREPDEEVSVQVTDVDPEWESFDQERKEVEGAYSWRIEVPAGATKTMKASYEVSLSAKHEIVGGNRREE
jgi:hypothetical protein